MTWVRGSYYDALDAGEELEVLPDSQLIEQRVLDGSQNSVSRLKFNAK